MIQGDFFVLSSMHGTTFFSEKRDEIQYMVQVVKSAGSFSIFVGVNSVGVPIIFSRPLSGISAVERGSVIERILNEIRGRMMEDIVLLETTMAKPEKEVFRLRFAIGEFDMVVVDERVPKCEIYEIKHSDKVVPAQYRFLSDTEKQKATEFRYGRIIRKAVIYRGESTILDNGIEYINVEEYLKSL